MTNVRIQDNKAQQREREKRESRDQTITIREKREKDCTMRRHDTWRNPTAVRCKWVMQCHDIVRVCVGDAIVVCVSSMNANLIDERTALCCVRVSLPKGGMFGCAQKTGTSKKHGQVTSWQRPAIASPPSDLLRYEFIGVLSRNSSGMSS